jgi:hypothetical protein
MTFLLFKRLAKAWRGACCEIDGFGIISGDACRRARLCLLRCGSFLALR